MYSTADIAKRLGCTVQAVNKYRRKIEKRDGKQLGLPDLADARRTLFSEDEVSLIAELAPKIPVTTPTDSQIVDAELLDGEDTEKVIEPQNTSLALRHSTLPAAQLRRETLDKGVRGEDLEELRRRNRAKD